MTKSNFLDTLSERGFIKDATDLNGLRAVGLESGFRPYIGFDLTAPALHVGSLIQLMVLRHAVADDANPIVLLGGATTRVGDPTGKDTARPALTHQAIAENMGGIIPIIDRVAGRTTLVDNMLWMRDLSYMDFLADVAPNFTVNRMLALDSVCDRLARQNPMTVLEFNYSMMQAIDFYELHDRYGVNLQIGGSDQWSNIIGGIELTRRKTGKQVFGLTTPLLTNAAGEKMGKTVGGAIWLDKELTSTYNLWQFWRNVEDEKVGQFLGLFTELPMDEVRRLGSLKGREINSAKIVLANAVVAIVHGQDEADAAYNQAKLVYRLGDAGLTAPQTIEITRTHWDELTLPQIMKEYGLAESNGAAARLLAAGSWLNHENLHTSGYPETTSGAIATKGILKLMVPGGDAEFKIGKKRLYRLVRIT